MKRRCMLPIWIGIVLMVFVGCSVQDDFPDKYGNSHKEITKNLKQFNFQTGLCIIEPYFGIIFKQLI